MNVNTKIVKIATIEDIHYSKLFNVDSVKEKLGDYVKRIRKEKSFSVADVNERSGNGISTSYINKIENEPNVNPSYPKILALAKGLGVTEQEIFSIIGGKKSDKEKITNEKLAMVSFGYEGMPKGKKEKLDPIIELLEREYQRILREGE